MRGCTACPIPRRASTRRSRHVELLDRANEIAGKLSKGLKQRVAIARALIHKPRVLLLDEPTSGLDPASARHVRDLILGLRSEGRAILVSTHNLGEAEELSDRIAVLKTDLLAFDTPATLRKAQAGSRVVIELEGGERREFAIERRGRDSRNRRAGWLAKARASSA